MYHDIGKILNPHFFVENQVANGNPHDMLDNPAASARIIIGHVNEGSRLARHYRLPHRLRDFILEHHGTTQVVYFYQQALDAAAETGAIVNVADYTYPGPRPQSRETAILMLADGCESSVRARRPQNKEEIAETVDYIFDLRLEMGELDDSGLTSGRSAALACFLPDGTARDISPANRLSRRAERRACTLSDQPLSQLGDGKLPEIMRTRNNRPTRGYDTC